MGTEGKLIALLMCMIFIMVLIIVSSDIGRDSAAIERCVAKVILDYKQKGILK